jgi:hypothetical protein
MPRAHMLESYFLLDRHVGRAEYVCMSSMRCMCCCRPCHAAGVSARAFEAGMH